MTNAYVVLAQGAKDSVTPIASPADSTKYTSFRSHVLDRYRTGVFTTRLVHEEIGIDGRCYFHVWGKVPRLNQGAYHPSFNDKGTGIFNNANASNGAFWYSTALDPLTTQQCFNVVPDPTTDTTTVGVTGTSGFVGSVGGSGREDGRFYDAIYEGGQGGVEDDRLSAYDMSSPEEAAKIDAKVKNGTYRGAEKLVYTKAMVETALSALNGATAVTIPLGQAVNYKAGDTVSIYDAVTGNIVIENQVISGSGTDGGGTADFLSWSGSAIKQTYNRLVQPYYVVASAKTDYTVSGEFECVDVLGDPEQILATPQLANGWLGYWIPDLRLGSISVQLTRKSLTTSGARTLTDDNGATWSSATMTINVTTNSYTTTTQANRVFVLHYTAAAYVTEVDVHRRVLNHTAGLGSVDTFAYFGVDRGVLFAESLMNKVITNGNATLAGRGGYALTKNNLGNSSSIYDLASWGYPHHTPLQLIVPPDNDSPACKALMQQSAENQGMYLNYSYEELAYTSGAFNPWGDDRVMVISDGQVRGTDTNGVSIVRGTNRTVKRHGYSINRARAGTQTEDVDL